MRGTEAGLAVLAICSHQNFDFLAERYRNAGVYIKQREKDARKLGERLRAVRFIRVFTSPKQRARQTSALAGLAPVAQIEPR
jgi:hypothetical protein